MPELRWILLIVGALLVAGLWWWELKRSRGTRDVPPLPAEPETPASQSRQEPRFGDFADDERAREAPSIRLEDRPIPRGDPPVLTIDDLPEDTDRVFLAESPEPPRMEPITARRDTPGGVVLEKITIGTPPGTPTL